MSIRTVELNDQEVTTLREILKDFDQPFFSDSFKAIARGIMTKLEALDQEADVQV